MAALPPPPFVLLEFPRFRNGRYSTLFANPSRVVMAERIEEVRPALRAVEQAVADGHYAVGYLSYEASPAFDPAFAVREGARMPLLWFGLFEGYEQVEVEQLATPGNFWLSEWRPTTSRSEYEADIAAIRAAIARGDSYQVNYTMRLRAEMEGEELALYRRLRQGQRAQYGAYLHLGRYRVLSASPELFFHREGDRLITRPMKGTVRRGRWPEEDEAQAAWLAASEKNRAENLMIVDLLRNDLGRVARTGTVQVPRLFEIERYPTLFQMTSTVTAIAREGLTLEALFAALFPCGSITGAPKVSTMRLIAALEEAPREIYCGAIGVIAPDGEATFNVAIRTVWVDGERALAEYGVGGGVTWDSTAEGEYEEAFVKAALLTEKRPAFSLLETLRLAGGEYDLLERHLQRLAASAAYFDIPFDRAAIGRVLAAHAAGYPNEVRRVRLLLSQAGEITVESGPLSSLPPGPLPVVLATTPISRKERFLYHKSTHRALYEQHRRAHPEAFDVLLWNEQGELTEFTIGNLVAEIDGERVTPPVESGLLPGTLRGELLARGEIREQRLTPAELERASTLWLINSVRGWVEVALVRDQVASRQ